MSILPPFREQLQRLVATPSVSSVSPQWDQSNAGVIDLLETWFGELGFATRRQPIPGCPNKFNLVAAIGRGGDGLVLSGHTDTVPCDPDRWHGDPFTLRETDERYYGLGTCDMKGFFAVVLEALREIDLKQLRKPLVVLATADEESTMCGARALAGLGEALGRHAVIGEPTELTPVRLHKGITMEAVRVIGRAGHSSNPALGRNALEGMNRVLGEILAWRDELQARHRNPLFEVAVPTLNLGHIHGGDNPNRICGSCEVHFDLRPLPGMALDELREALQAHLRACLADSGLDLQFKTLFPGVEALDTPADAPIVAAVEELTEQPARAVSFATEGPFLKQLGMDTVVLGPGSIRQAHQPDEYLAFDQIERGVALVRQLIGRFCL